MLEDEIIFTKHATERLNQRKISREMVISAIESPDRFFMEADGNTKFIRTIKGRKLHVVCQPLIEQHKWLVKSVWIRGEDDEGRIVQKSNTRLNVLFFLFCIVILILLLVLWHLYSNGSFT